MTSKENFYNNVMFEILNISNLRSILKVIDMKTFIDMKAVNIALIIVTAIINATMIFLNHDNLCCDIFDDFIIKSCTLESI